LTAHAVFKRTPAAKDRDRKQKGLRCGLLKNSAENPEMFVWFFRISGARIPQHDRGLETSHSGAPWVRITAAASVRPNFFARVIGVSPSFRRRLESAPCARSHPTVSTASAVSRNKTQR
jgi:hypothetical protein